MSHQRPVISINAAEGTSSIVIYVSDVLVTTHSYAAGMVSLDERLDPTVLDRAELIAITENFRDDWVKGFTKIMGRPVQTQEKFTETWKWKANKLTCKYTVEGADIVNAEYDFASGMFTFDPRAAAVITLRSYERLVSILFRFYNESGLYP